MSTGKGAVSAAPTPDMNDRLAAALEFAEIVPVVIVDGKNPGGLLGSGWQQKATRDEAVLRQWWATWPTGNVGIVPARELAPVDVDDPSSFERLQRETVEAPPTPRFYTGGAHPPGRERLLFAYPGALALAGLTDTMIAPGVQLRVPLPGRGALMSLIPPSLHPISGVRQEWRVGFDEVPLAPLPQEWLARVRRTNKHARPTSEWAEIFATDIVTGNGICHPTMVSMAGFLVRKLQSGQVALELLLAWNQRRCKPPKPEREIVELVAWTVRQEANR